jgi:peptide/nickel transport system substrate-binding protein
VAIFHDGKPCNADVIVAFILGFLDSTDYFGMPWSYRRYFARTSFTAEGDRVVKVVDPEPFADILNIFCDFWPSRIAEDGKPVLGTGPYRVAEFERESGIGRATLHKVNPTRHNGPHVIIATHEPDGAKRLQLLRNGEVDAALNLERVEDLSLLNFDPSLHWGRITSTLSVIYYLNCVNGVFSSSNARRAANLALDNAALVKEVYRGLALPSATVVSPFHLGFTESGLQNIPYDPEAARKIFRDLNISGPIKLRTPTYMPEHAEKITRFVVSSLEAVGLNVDVEVETNRPEYARQIGLRKQISDLALFDSTPNSTFRVLDDKISSKSRATWWLGYHDAETQSLIHEARKKITVEERAESYAKCLKRLNENPPWLYIAHPDVIWASRPGVTTINVGPSGILTLA